MDTKQNTFQMILIAVFAVCIVVGVLIFSKAKQGSGISFSPITIWGTVPAAEFNSAYSEINSLRDKSQGSLQVTYVQKKEETLDHDFIEALAAGTGPDAIIISEDLIVRYKDKIFPIPYESLSLRDFRDMYLDEAELFTTPEGVLGFPLYVDPLVMYWNKDILSSAGIATPPKLWTDLFTLSNLLTHRDTNNNILQSTIALGEFGNVVNAKKILSGLFLQAGNSITKMDNGVFRSTLGDGNSSFSPAESVVSFYTEFSNPNKISYSWNRSMPSSKNAFLAGDLALYLGFASEISDLRSKNPNLNFDVAAIPQPKDAKTKITYGKLNAFAVVKSGKNIQGTFQTLIELSKADFISLLAQNLRVAPSLRGLLSKTPKDPDLQVFYNQALISRGWLDPNVKESEVIFRNLVESVSSGRQRIGEAIIRASEELNNLITPSNSN